MKNKELFDKTIGILVNAYLNGTLMHNTCHACAVGNLVSANNGIEHMSADYRCGWKQSVPEWQALILPQFYGIELINQEEAQRQVASTGYTIKELTLIENSFENVDSKNALIDNDDKWMFDGLMSVCDTLMQIHETTDTEIEKAKSLFVLN